MRDNFLTIWQFLTQPDKKLQDRGLRQRAAIFSAFVLIWLLVLPVAILVWVLNYGWSVPLVLVTFAILLILGASYWLSRTTRYLIAARLYVVSSLVLTLAMYLLIDIHHPHQILYYMASGVLVAGLVLPVRDLVLTILLAETLIFIAPLLYPGDDFPRFSALLYIGIMGLLTLIFVQINEYYRRAVDASEARFRTIFNQSVHYIGVLACDGRIQSLNEQSYQFFGLKPDEVIGKHLWEIQQWAHTGAIRQKVREYVEQAAQGAQLRYEGRVANADGDLAFFDTSIKPVLDDSGTVTMLIVESRDISAYRRAEEKRYEYERRYETLFENTADAVFIIDLEGIIAHANRVAQTMLGVELDQIIGQPAERFIAPEDQSEMHANLAALQAGNSLGPVIERRMLRGDGTPFDAEITSVIVRDGDGKPRYIHSMIRDLEPRRRLEQQRFEIQLERERTRLLQRFIEQASHHFRTPITNVKTSAYLLPRLEDHPEKRRHHITIINEELQRLTNLLNDLLMVLRLQKDDSEFYITPVLMQSVLDELRVLQSSRETYQEYQWVWNIDGDDAIVIGDRERLARALLNIIENAINYTRQGGTITIALRQQEGWVAVYVRDTGIGIEASDLPHIFDDFFRSNTAMSQDSTSSGLGLTISRLIVERHQGMIAVDSTPGQGTTVQILLPIRTGWQSQTEPIPVDLRLNSMEGDAANDPPLSRRFGE